MPYYSSSKTAWPTKNLFGPYRKSGRGRSGRLELTGSMAGAVRYARDAKYPKAPKVLWPRQRRVRWSENGIQQ